MQKLKSTAFTEVVAQFVPATDARDERIPAAAQGLHVCRACGSGLVNPMWCERRSDDSWQMALGCPNCGWSGIGCFEHRLIEQFDRELERGEAELEADLAWLTHVNMVDEIERFVRALSADAIQPFDF
jgi:hypothetical protein